MKGWWRKIAGRSPVPYVGLDEFLKTYPGFKRFSPDAVSAYQKRVERYQRALAQTAISRRGYDGWEVNESDVERAADSLTLDRRRKETISAAFGGLFGGGGISAAIAAYAAEPQDTALWLLALALLVPGFLLLGALTNAR